LPAPGNRLKEWFRGPGTAIDPRKEERVSLNVYFQPIDVGLIQGLVFDYVRGKGTLEALRTPLRRRWEIGRTVGPWKRMLSEVYRAGGDKLPDWFDGETFQQRHFFIVENAPERVAELMDLYLHAPDDGAVRQLIGAQLALLDPEGVNVPGRWAPKPVEWRWNVEEQVERSMALLAPYAATPGGKPKKPLDNEFTRDLLELNEDLQPIDEVYDYPLGTVVGWATAELGECLEPPDDLFRPLFAEHPDLEEDLSSEGRYPWCYGAGMYIRPANVPRARQAVEASLPEDRRWRPSYDSYDFAPAALWKLANLLRYAERRGLGLIERCA
jgi:hypothetical protein